MWEWIESIGAWEAIKGVAVFLGAVGAAVSVYLTGRKRREARREAEANREAVAEDDGDGVGPAARGGRRLRDVMRRTGPDG